MLIHKNHTFLARMTHECVDAWIIVGLLWHLFHTKASYHSWLIINHTPMIERQFYQNSNDFIEKKILFYDVTFLSGKKSLRKLM